MSQEEIATDVVHEVPDGLREILTSSPEVIEKWNGLTPLARNVMKELMMGIDS